MVQGSLIKVPSLQVLQGLCGPQVELGGGFEVGGSVDMPEWYVEPYRHRRRHGDDL